MFGELEDLAVIGALTLEYAAGVMQSMAQDMKPGVPPRNEFAIHPDNAVALIVRNECHCLSPERVPAFRPRNRLDSRLPQDNT